MAHTISAATAGLEYNGTPLMVRATGCVGSLCSSGIFEPTVAKAFSVLSASTVAGAATNAVTVVNNVSALLLAASKASKLDQLAPLLATAVVNDPKPLGPLGVVPGAALKNTVSSWRLTSLVMPSPTTPSAAGLESLANSELMMLSAANFFGVTTCSVTAASLA